MINDCGIIDCGYEGSKYTWSNNQEDGGFVWARLDRVFTNPAWADVFSSIYYGETLTTLNIRSFSYAYPD
jgi:hypothetical protein